MTRKAVKIPKRRKQTAAIQESILAEVPIAAKKKFELKTG